MSTFGSPPVTSVDVTTLACKQPQCEFALSFVNEYDIVSRADPSYISSIIDLYRSRYGLPSMATDQPRQVEAPPRPEKAMLVDRFWTLPPPTFHLVGEAIILRATTAPSDVGPDDASSDAPTISTTHEAMQLTPQALSQTLFCEVGVHKRRLYLERMRAVTSAGKASSVFSRAETLVSRSGEPIG